MKKSTAIAAITIALLILASSLFAGKKESGFVSLFNGKDFSGWKLPGKEHNWQVIDGVIDYEAKGGNIVTEKSFKDYDFRLDWRFKRTEGPTYNAKLFDAEGNHVGKKPVKNAYSGIFLRGTGKSQVNLWCWPCGSGQLWAFHGSKNPAIRKGSIPKVNADKPVGQWTEMKITMKGETVTVILNGKTVLDKSNMPGVAKAGPITLQLHGGYNAKSKTWNNASALIQFRNLRIK